MATAKECPLVIPFCAIMFNNQKLCEEALNFLKTELGDIAKISDEVDFSAETDYYGDEMGGKIKKIYMVFKKTMKREYLADLKCKTNAFEQKFAINGEKRQINLDPGYITKDKFVLASAKDFSHRIAIGQGIFAEVTLNFSVGNKIRRFSWTYNDYLIPNVQEVILFGRKLLK